MNEGNEIQKPKDKIKAPEAESYSEQMSYLVNECRDERQSIADPFSESLMSIGGKDKSGEAVDANADKEKVKKLLEVAIGFAEAFSKYPKKFKGPYEYMGQIIKHAPNCGKWVEKIRRLAGFKSPAGKVVFDGQSRYKGDDYRGHEAKPAQLRKLLSPGDWVWYYNGNSNWRGLHSAMFLGWKDEDKLIANCAGGDASIKWRVYEDGVNLNPKSPNGNPVVWINKPIA